MEQDGKNKQKHTSNRYWYKTVIYECVLCGSQEIYRYRVYDEPKPVEYYDRNEYRQKACWSHFL